jgi:hypothetical protein
MRYSDVDNGLFQFIGVGSALATGFALYKGESDWAVLGGAICVASVFAAYNTARKALSLSKKTVEEMNQDQRFTVIWAEMDKMNDAIEKKVEFSDFTNFQDTVFRKIEDNLVDVHSEINGVYRHTESMNDETNRRIDNEMKSLADSVLHD